MDAEKLCYVAKLTAKVSDCRYVGHNETVTITVEADDVEATFRGPIKEQAISGISREKGCEKILVGLLPGQGAFQSRPGKIAKGMHEPKMPLVNLWYFSASRALLFIACFTYTIFQILSAIT